MQDWNGIGYEEQHNGDRQGPLGGSLPALAALRLLGGLLLMARMLAAMDRSDPQRLAVSIVGHKSLKTTDRYARPARHDFAGARSSAQSYIASSSAQTLRAQAVE